MPNSNSFGSVWGIFVDFCGEQVNIFQFSRFTTELAV